MQVEGVGEVYLRTIINDKLFLIKIHILFLQFKQILKVLKNGFPKYIFNFLLKPSDFTYCVI